MTTLRVLLHVAAQHDYELHSLDFSTAFLQGTQWNLRRPFYSLCQAPRECHDTWRTTLAALGFAPATAELSLFLYTDTLLLPFYVLVYADDLVFATTHTEALTLVKSEMQKRHTCTDVGPSALRLPVLLATAHSSVYQPLTLSSTFGRVCRAEWSVPRACGCLMYLMTCIRPDLTYPLSLLAPVRYRKVQWDAAKRVLSYLCSTSGMGLVLGGRGPVVITCHADASWVFTDSSCEAEIYARAMAAQELCWLSYLLTDPGELPPSPPILYRGQLRLAYVATRANTADIFTKALQSGDHQRFSSMLGLVPPEVPSDARAASPSVAHLLATSVTDPSFESSAASALVGELLDFVAACRLDYATALVAESESATPPSVGGKCALGTHVLEDSTAFLQGSLHEEIWLRRPRGFTGSFPAGTQWSLSRPVYGLRQAPREWPDTLRTTLAALGFTPSTADPSLFLRTDTSLPPFYVLLYITRDRARRTITLTQSHMVHHVLQRFGFQFFFATSHSSVYRPLALSSSCEAEIHAGAMAAQELRWLTYLLNDLGEQPRSPPVLYVYNKAMIALCQQHRLEHRRKHIAMQYFLASELQQCGQLRLAYVATRANTADVFTKALPPGDHQRFSTVLGLVPTFLHLLTA
ncbi:unnamed protein product [Closterium sp. NIES-53]